MKSIENRLRILLDEIHQYEFDGDDVKYFAELMKRADSLDKDLGYFLISLKHKKDEKETQ